MIGDGRERLGRFFSFFFSTTSNKHRQIGFKKFIIIIIIKQKGHIII
jgi:hypothetical protein